MVPYLFSAVKLEENYSIIISASLIFLLVNSPLSMLSEPMLVVMTFLPDVTIKFYGIRFHETGDMHFKIIRILG